MRGICLLLFSGAVAASALPQKSGRPVGRQCSSYRATDVHETGSLITAQLQLVGQPCNTYGKDLENLVLKVEAQTETRLHVMITDLDEQVYQVPEDVFPRPNAEANTQLSKSALKFAFKRNPFSFSITRRDTGEVLFDTSGSDIVFQSQYLKLRTSLPDEPNIYGLGEHSDRFRLNTTDYVRTLWNRDSYSIPAGTNLYGSHPIYIDHRGESGTHGVFLLNSNGMDIKINRTERGEQYLEYNTLGGVFDFYFFAGPSPREVASQYAEVAGLPVMMPYWGFGFHQCRYGYRDVFDVAEVVYNYTLAHIPLETMWTDIDYMDRRMVFTLDPQRFPIEKMRALVSYLHDRDQHYIVMVDPAVGLSDNPAFNRGAEQDIFIKLDNGSVYKGAVWPGVTVYPDWFHEGVNNYWNNEFAEFFDAETGVDIDALWIDMNEPANFVNYGADPEQWAIENDLPPDPPPVRENPRPLPGFPGVFQPPSVNVKRAESAGKKMGLPDREFIDPPYEIQNAAGSLSNKTINTDLVHANGLVEYDVHNLYGTMMSMKSRQALLHRRPTKRPLVITRSTFAGVGAHVGKWLGDNLSEWSHYRSSIAQQLGYASIYQVPMVGSDTCGFGGNVTETLCARWAMLAAFSPFYRNHNEIKMIAQEFYRWESVAEAARRAIEIRYKLLDYFYTAFSQQTKTGIPALSPMFYLYPNDKGTFGIDLQFFYGPAILVSPVTEENSTSVDIYLPDDIFYDYHTGAPVRGEGKSITLDDVEVTDIPLHIRGGNIVIQRTEGDMTTTGLREKPFEIIIAPDLNGKATGSLYLDDGDSIEQPATSEIEFGYEDSVFKMTGRFDFKVADSVKIVSITILGQDEEPTPESAMQLEFDAKSKKVTAQVDLPLTGAAEVKF